MKHGIGVCECRSFEDIAVCEDQRYEKQEARKPYHHKPDPVNLSNGDMYCRTCGREVHARVTRHPDRMSTVTLVHGRAQKINPADYYEYGL
jgi:hypothetical protein